MKLVMTIRRSEKLGAWIAKNPIIILAAAAILTVMALHYAQNISMETGTEAFVDPDTRLYLEYDHLYLERFGTDSIVVLVEGDDVTRPEVLRAMDRLTGHMEGANHVLGSVSISEMVKGEMERETGVRAIPDHEKVREILESLNPEMVKGIMPDERHTMVSIDVPLSIEDSVLEELLAETEKAVDLAEFPPGMGVVVTGNVALGYSIKGDMSKDTGVLLVVSSLLMVVALLLVFRHVRLPLMPLPVVLLGIVWTFGAMGLLEISLSFVSMAAFPVLIGLGIDYAIQLQSRIEEEFDRTGSMELAAVSTVSHTAPAVMIALVITSAGFVSLFISSVPMVRDFGLLCLIGVSMCYLSALFVGVTLLCQMQNRWSAKSPGLDPEVARPSAIGQKIEKVAIFSLCNWKGVLVLALVFTSVGFYADSQVPIETDFKEYIPQDLPPLVTFRHLKDVFGGDDQLNLILQTGDITDPATLRWMDEFGTYISESREQVYGVTSIATYVKAYNGGEIPQEKTQAREVLDSIPEGIRDRYIDGQDSALIQPNIGSAVQDLGEEGIDRLIGEVEKDVAWIGPPPGTSVAVTGDLVVMTTVIEALTTGRIKMTLLGLVLIFGILMLIYRDPVKAALPVLPMIVVIGLMGIVMRVSGMVYTPLTATLGALILGVGSEYAVLTLERFYEEKEKTESSVEALRIATSRIGAAIAASGLTTVFGFSALATSSFPITSNFGAVTVLSVIFALFVTFTVFPVLLIRLQIFPAYISRAEDRLKMKGSTGDD
jgi:hydrophobe/amphiphile efflux-3 (HAE3) family protein